MLPARPPHGGPCWLPDGLGDLPETAATAHFTHILELYTKKHGISAHEFTVTMFP